MSAKKSWGGRLVRLDRLGSTFLLALGGSFLGGGLAVGAFGTEMEKPSTISVVVED